HLAFVPLACEAEGFVEPRQVVLGTVLAHLGFQFAVQHPDRIAGWQRGRRVVRETGGFGGHANSIVTAASGDPPKNNRGARPSGPAPRTKPKPNKSYLEESSATIPPPVFLDFLSALTLMVARALSVHSLATLICAASSSLLSARSARSRISRFLYDMA